jgi:hypothetical protein
MVSAQAEELGLCEWFYASNGNCIIFGPEKLVSRSRSKISRLVAITLPDDGFSGTLRNNAVESAVNHPECPPLPPLPPLYPMEPGLLKFSLMSLLSQTSGCS